MTQAEFNALSTGDIVGVEGKANTYVVTANYGGRVTAVQTVDMTNPREWVLVAKARQERVTNYAKNQT